MKTITYKLKDLEEKKEKKVTLKLGYVGENEHVQIRIDCAEIWKDYPAAVASLAVEPPEGEKYPAIVTRDGDMVCWTVKDSDLANDGYGRIQLTFTEGSEIQKTVICRTKVDESIIGSGTAPDPIQDWIDEANEVVEEAREAAAAAEHQPRIGQDGYWEIWDLQEGQYVTTGVKAQGEQGDPGPAGEDGAPGQDGHTPEKGVDYWTEQDLAAMAADVVSDVIDDTAGDGDTNKTWSADKLDEEFGELLTDITKEETAIESAMYPMVNTVDEMTDTTKKYVLKSNFHIYESTGQPGDPPNEFDIWQINQRLKTTSPYYLSANGYLCTELIKIDRTADASATIRLKNAANLPARYGTNTPFGSCKYEWFTSDKTYISNNYMTGYNGSNSYWKFTVDGDDLVASFASVPNGIPENAEYISFCWVTVDTPVSQVAENALPAITETDVTAKNYGIYISTHHSTVYGFVDTGIVYSVGRIVDSHENRIDVLEKRAGNDIVGQNSDVIDCVNASCRYGIHSNGQQNTSKQFSLLVTTDPHRCWDRMDAAVEYLNKTNAIDAGCCLGDIVGSDFTENTDRYNQAVAASEKPFLTVIGNHDCGNSKNPAVCGTTAQVLAKFITPNEAAMGKSGMTVPYYTWIDTDHKITFICLYLYDSPETIVSGEYTYARGAECYSQTQVDWLITTLGNVPSDHGVVIMEHAYKEPNEAEVCSWTQLGKEHISNNINTGYGNVQIISEIINAWINGTTFTGSFAPTDAALPTINISCDYTSRGAGEFICYIVGHQHNDIIAHNAKYNNQKVICLCSTADDNWQNYSSDLPRVQGEKSQNSITVVSFDRISKRINLVRVGSNKTIYMTDRTMFSMQYIEDD